MKYFIDYEIASLCVLGLLLVIYLMRRSIGSTTSKIFVWMLVCNFVSVLFNTISAYTISYPERVSLPLNYFTNIVYLLTVCLSAVIFFVYVVYVTGEKKYKRFLLWLTAAVVAADTLLLVTTPLTKLVIYFDGGEYTHGPLFVMLYVNCIPLIVSELLLFFKYRKKLNNLQVFTVFVFNFAMIAAIVLQMFIADLLIQDFVVSLFLVLLYISLQNPEDYIDKASGCFNQAAFYEILENRIVKKSPFTLIAFTLDDIQYVNRTLGVRAGNELLDGISVFLSKKFGRRNVFRLMGARYAVLLDERAKFTENGVISAVRTEFAKPYSKNNIEVLLSPFICVLHYPEFQLRPADINDALESAFKTLSDSRDKTVLEINEDSLKQKRRQSKIINIMKRAILYKGFDVYYQPIYDIKKGRFCTAEALVRLYDKELGFISPDEFIPMAEKNGMIIEIGEIVFRKVCRFLKETEKDDLGIEYIEVNLSAVQCIQENLAQRLSAIMAEYKVSPGKINFEITETAHSANENALQRNMDALIGIGSSFSMDDYGTGFSTANHLISLPLKIVKIDKSILWPAIEDAEALTVLYHTVNMLKALDKEIVVEGVENEAMEKLLTEMGCNYLQGFLYSKPVPQEQFIAFLREKNSAF